MLSTDVMRYVELHRAVGFRFHTQHQLLSGFAAFALLVAGFQKCRIRPQHSGIVGFGSGDLSRTTVSSSRGRTWRNASTGWGFRRS
jgi:hypothetical protein